MQRFTRRGENAVIATLSVGRRPCLYSSVSAVRTIPPGPHRHMATADCFIAAAFSRSAYIALWPARKTFHVRAANDAVSAFSIDTAALHTIVACSVCENKQRSARQTTEAARRPDNAAEIA